MLLNDDHWSYLEWFEKFYRNKSDKCKKINLLTQEPSLHSCLRTPMLGENWELAATSQDPPPPQPPDIQRIELMMAMIRGTAHSRVSRGLIAERIRWWTSHDQDELVVKMNFLFWQAAMSWFSCFELSFIVWPGWPWVTMVGGSEQCRACQENIYWLQAGAGHRAGCKSFLRFMASDTDSHETQSVNIFQQWMDTSHSQLLQLHPWHSEVEIF